MSLPNAPADELTIVPSETRLSLDEWKIVRAGLLKGANPNTKKRLDTLIVEKKITKRRLKPGPKSQKPADEHRTRKQNYLWLLRTILDASDSDSEIILGDEQALDRAYSVIQNFNALCAKGAFLTEQEVATIRTICKKTNADLPNALTDFLKDLEQSIKRIKPGAPSVSWESLLSSESGAPDSSADAFRLDLLAHALGVNDAEFTFFVGDKRSRKKNSGRRRQRMQIASDEQPQKNDQAGAELSKIEKSFSEASIEEILQKTVSRLILIKNVIHFRHLITLQESSWSTLLQWENKQFSGSHIGTDLPCALDVLWTAVRRQPTFPNGYTREVEDAGRIVHIPAIGLLEVPL